MKKMNKPTILWASPRTASSAFFYQYVNRNNLAFDEHNHEPLLPKDVDVNPNRPIYRSIHDILKRNLSFKYMISGYTHGTLEKIEVKKLYDALPALDYYHIILFRKDVYARHKSLAFSFSTNIWDRQHIKENKYEGWSKQIDWPISHNYALKSLKQSLDGYINLINFLEDHGLEYEIIEFENACKYIEKDTSQGTNHYYNEYEDLELKDKLENLLNNHKFMKIWNSKDDMQSSI